ncbi:hypothetical protein HDZ31DRAFT_46477 [Schizophyllum fasciatum]
MPQQPLINGAPGVEITFANASAASVLRPMHYGCQGIDENAFFILPGAPLSTRLPRLRGRKLSYEEYTTLGKTWHSMSSPVFYAETVGPDQNGPRRCFALKVVFNVHGGKDTSGSAMMENLRHEAIFYNRHLKSIQGIAVPKHYGVWLGRTAWGTTVACAIMEWCGQPYDRRLTDPNDARGDRRQRIMDAIKALHGAGFEHNDLGGGETNHLLYDTKREQAFIVDFSDAEKHECGLKMELLPYTTLPMPLVLGCEELWRMGKAIGYFKKGPATGPGADIRVVKATEEADRQLEERLIKQEIRRQLVAAGKARRASKREALRMGVSVPSKS